MNALVIMTRIPIPGKTKTRLEGILTKKQCADIHSCFLKDILEESKKIEDIYRCIYHSDEGDLEVLIDIVGEDISLHKQVGETLGDRMENIFIKLFREGYTKIVLIGTDIPEIDKKVIDRSYDLLDKNDIVFGPTLDGGYYLVGMNRVEGIVFDKSIKWGTEDVFKETLEIIKESGLEVAQVEKLMDIDTSEELISLSKRIDERVVYTKSYIERELKGKV